GQPSMWRDWREGRFDRTLAAFAGGLACGFLWEFWNYWALCKWVYHLPFLGPLERYKYFEMPLPGLLGFLPFGLECWVLWQLPRKGGTVLATGPVPSASSIDQARVAARQCVLNALAAANAVLGSLDRVAGVVRVGAFVLSDPGFADQPKVADGASELLLDLF